MFKYLRKHRTLVMISLAVCVVVVPFIGIGTLSFRASPHDTIFKVNGRKVSQGQFDRLYNQILRQKKDLTLEQRKQLNSESLNELIRQEVFSQEAKKLGVHVTEQELQMELLSIPAFQKEGRFDAPTYVRVIGEIFGTIPSEFEKGHKKDMEGRRLNQLIATTAHISDDVLQRELEKRLKSETDKKKLEELKKDPEILRKELHIRETNLIMKDWLNQLNSKLKINFTSESFKKRLTAGSE